MKIAINTLAMHSYRHGVGRYIGNMVNELLTRDKKNSYVLFVSPENKKYFPSKNEKINITEISCPKSIRIFWEHFVLPFYLYFQKVDLYWGPTFTAPIFKTTKQIITIHDMTWFITPETHTIFKRLYFQNVLKIIGHKVDAIISDSYATTRDIKDILKVSDDKITTIHCGIETKFGVSDKDTNLVKIKRKYSLPEKYILFIGVFEPRKNIIRLIRGFAKAKENLPKDIKLVVGGGKNYGWKNSDIYQIVRELKLEQDVIFLEDIDDEELPFVYNLATAFVLPSLYEGFGFPILESQACGCPVITSNISSMPEVAGEGAYLVDPYKIDNITDSLIKVSVDNKLRKELKDKGLINIKRFSWEKAVSELLLLMNSLS